MVKQKDRIKSKSDATDCPPKASGSGVNAILEDDRFNRVAADPRFRAYKPDTKVVELDKRFERVLNNNKKFEVKDDLFFNEASSSSDESSSDEEPDQFEAVDEWEEEDQKCYRDDVEETRRIAICNLDWDRINATDIFVLLNSFKPAQGDIRSVRVYMSEYGKQRLAEEKVRGPKELIELPEDVGREDESAKMISTIKYANDEDDEMNRLGYVQNKLRKYQINRLRYFYAVAEFDCADTAVEIYEQLDGFEYLASSVTIDLRFIPDDMEFEEEPTSQCEVLPDLNFYQAPTFINTALQQTKVRLTWEENNQDMSKKLQKAFEDVENNKEVAYLDQYLASDTENDQDSLSDYESESGEDDLEHQPALSNDASQGEIRSETTEKLKEKKKDKILKYKNLLKSIEDEEERKKKEKSKFDLEINWGPEMDTDQKGIDGDTESDDDDCEDFDPDMTEEKRDKLAKKESYKVSNKKKKKRANKKSMSSVDANESTESHRQRDQQNAELELLLLDSEDKDKKHFNYANFVENSKLVAKDKKAKKIQQDDFKFNSEDPRFSAIYDSHAFNIDPSNPKYKRTKAFKEIIQKKIKRN